MEKLELKCTCPPTRWEKAAADHDLGCPIGDFIAGKTFQVMPAADVIAAEQLARMFHQTYESLAPHFRYRTREASAMPWEKLDNRHAMLMIATAANVLAEFDKDPGDTLTMLVGKQAADGKIRVDFAKRLRWFSMERNAAVNFALTILQHCGVAVNVEIKPPAPRADA